MHIETKVSKSIDNFCAPTNFSFNYILFKCLEEILENRFNSDNFIHLGTWR